MAVYWVGQDGNVWYKSGGSTQNMGAANTYELQNDGIRAYLGSGNPTAQQLAEGVGWSAADRISDPLAPTGSPTTTTAPSGSTAPARVAPVLNQAAVNNTQLTIDQLPGILQAALTAEGTRYDNTVRDFQAQETGQRGTYDKSTTTNQLNYDSNFMDSIRAGIKGLGGLMALLRGTGASGGTVDDTVRDTVGGVTSNDIRAGADTRNENQGALDSSLSEFLTSLGVKRKTNEDTRVNNERSLRRDTDTQLQDLYGKMAGFYGDAEMTGQRDNWMNRAGSLTPAIAANSSARVSPYDTTPVPVQAPQLTAFAAPTQPNVLAAPSDGQVGSGIFTMSDRRRREPALAGA